MDYKAFSIVWADALTAADRAEFVSGWSLSSLFLDPEDDTAAPDPGLSQYLGQVWDAAHMDMAAICTAAGMTSAQLEERLCCSPRKVENWRSRGCPDYVRLLILEVLGLLPR